MKIGCLFAMVLAVLTAPSMVVSSDVLEHHVNGTRDGAYVDPLMTRKIAAGLRQDKNFNAPIQGPTYAQPLYVSNGPGSKATLIVVTERDAVIALDAATGAQVWTKTLGSPVPRSQLPCGNIDPLGITGTPVIDPNSRTIYVAAMTTPDGGRTKQHLIFALSLDDGSTRSGWPVNVSGMKYSSFSFNSSVQYSGVKNPWRNEQPFGLKLYRKSMSRKSVTASTETSWPRFSMTLTN